MFLNIFKLLLQLVHSGIGPAVEPFLFRSTMFIAHVHPYGEEQFPWVSGSSALHMQCYTAEYLHCFSLDLLGQGL